MLTANKRTICLCKTGKVALWNTTTLAKRIPQKIQYLKQELAKNNWTKLNNSNIKIANEELHNNEYKLEFENNEKDIVLIESLGCVVILDTTLYQWHFGTPCHY